MGLLHRFIYGRKDQYWSDGEAERIKLACNLLDEAPNYRICNFEDGCYYQLEKHWREGWGPISFNRFYDGDIGDYELKESLIACLDREEQQKIIVNARNAMKGAQHDNRKS